MWSKNVTFILFIRYWVTIANLILNNISWPGILIVVTMQRRGFYAATAKVEKGVSDYLPFYKACDTFKPLHL